MQQQQQQRRAASSSPAARRLLLLLLALAGATVASAFVVPAAGPPHRPQPTCSSSCCSSSSRRAARDTVRASAVEETAAAAAAAGPGAGKGGGAPRRPPVPKPNGPWILLEGLPYAAGEADLRAFLEGFEVKAVQMPLAPENTKRAGETKGIGIVELGSEAEAQRAVGNLNGKEILGRWVTVEQCVDPGETKTIKIRGVPFAATPEDLSQYFGGLFGEVEHVVISHDRNGIAYVTFKENSAAVAALAQDGCQMNNRWLDITLYLKGAFRPQQQQERSNAPRQQPQGERERPPSQRGGQGGTYSRRNRLRLSGLPFEATREEVAAAMAGLGLEVSNVFLPPFKGNPERNIGLAYLNAADEAAFQRALEIGNFVLGERTVYINEAQERVTLSGPGGSSQRSPRGEGEGFRDEGEGGGEQRRRANNGGGGGGGTRDAPWAHRVYMGNLPFDIEAEDIAAFFRGKGVSGLSKIALPKTKVGTAYVAFDSQESAEAAAALDGTLIEKAGRTRYLRANLMDA